MPGHQIVPLRTRSGRRQLIEYVWGKMVREASTAPIASALSFLAGVAAVVGAVMVLTPSGLQVPGMFMALVGFGARFVLGEMNTKTVVEHRERFAPLPGIRPTPRLAGGSSIVGTVTSTETAPTPILGTDAVAFAVTLSVDENPTGILCDAATIGFTVVTREGGVIEIPRGTIEIVTHGRPLDRYGRALQRHLARLDPLRRSSDDRDPFIHDDVAEVAVCVGDHVAIHNPIIRKGFDHSGMAGGYRESAREIYAIDGVPCIERLP